MCSYSTDGDPFEAFGEMDELVSFMCDIILRLPHLFVAAADVLQLKHKISLVSSVSYCLSLLSFPDQDVASLGCEDAFEPSFGYLELLVVHYVAVFAVGKRCREIYLVG